MQAVSMKTIRQWKRRLMPLAFYVLLLTSVLAAGELGTENGVLRSRVYPLKYITSQQAQEFFSQLHIGKSYNALTPDVLIVTSNVGSDLVKATGIIGILDQSSPVKIEILSADSRLLPKRDTFIAGLKTITVGTMIESPKKETVKPAIIDVLDDKLIAIASEDVMKEIETAFQEWEKANLIQTPENGVAKPLEQMPQAETPKPIESEMFAKPEVAAEPNLSRVAPEPKELVEPNVEMAAPDRSLEEIAQHLFETTLMTDANDLTDEPMTESTDSQTLNGDDFLSEGLLQELADAEQKAEIKDRPDETADAETDEADTLESEETESTTADVNEPVPSEALQDDPMKIMRALMAQARAEEKQPAVQTEQPASPTESIMVESVEPAKGAEPVQTESGQLPPTVQELEAKSNSANIAVPEPAGESKIQTSETSQTEPQLPPQLGDKELEVVVDLPQEVELESLVDLVGKQLGLNYMYDPAILRNQKVQLKVHGGKIKVKDVYSLLESVLKLKGFAMTRDQQLVTIVKADNASQVYKQVDPVIRTPGEPIEAGNVIVSTLFQLDNIGTDSARKMLVSLNLGMTDGFQEIPETGTLLVTDFAYRMGRIEEVLSIIDIPGEKKEYKFRTLKYMLPSEMVPKLQDLAGKLQDVSLQINTPAAAAPAQQMRTVTTRDPQTGRTTTRQVPVTTPATAAPSAASQRNTVQQDSVFIDTDDRTNRILMAGKPDQIALINELIDALDVPQYDIKFVREYLIQNVEAQEVVDVINELGLASVSVTGASTTSPARRTTPASARAGAAAAGVPAAQTSASAGTNQPYIAIRGASNSLLVNATAEQHSAIELVIAHVDVVQKDQRTIRQYEIQNVDTQEILDTLTDLGIISTQTSSTQTSRDRTSSSAARQTPARTTQPQLAGAAVGEEAAVPMSLPTAEGGSEKEITAEQPQISVLEATNSLLVYATPRQHNAIALVIAHADKAPEKMSTPYVVYALENQNPVELEVVLTKLIQETVEDATKTSTPESKIQTGGATSTTAKLPTLEEQKIRIIPDEKSYSLIVYANKRNQQWISDLIKELDEYRPQVLLDLTLVEVSKLDQFQYDLDIIAANPDLDFTSGALNYGIGVQETPPSASTILGNLNNATDRNYFLEGTVKAGELAGFYGNDQIMALLQTMQKKNYGRILNRPKLLVNDNEEGSISLEQVTYREIVTTTIVGSDNPQTSENVNYQDYSAGITMTIKPHISKGDQLRLEITLNRSDFNIQEGDDPSLPPNTITSDVTTVVTVPDKNTIILGGLERINQSKGGTKVPILGDIPIIGGLFRSIGNSNDQRKTYIFVQANILRPGEDNLDLKNISQKNRVQFENMEKEMQEYQDWPGIDPKPMDPEKVLEEDDFKVEKMSEGGFVVQDNWPLEPM